MRKLRARFSRLVRETTTNCPGLGHANDNVAVFPSRMLRVGKRYRSRVIKHDRSFLGRDIVLSQIDEGFLQVPLKFRKKSLAADNFKGRSLPTIAALMFRVSGCRDLGIFIYHLSGFSQYAARELSDSTNPKPRNLLQAL